MGRGPKRWPNCLRTAAILAAAASNSMLAQGSTLVGSVTSDSAGKHGLEGIQVSIPALKRSVRSDSGGAYAFDSLAAGRYLVTARAIGYVIVEDSVTIDISHATHNFVLSRHVEPLAPVVTTAPKHDYISPALRAFEDRRLKGFGRFMSEDELRKHDNDRLSDVISAHAAGSRLVRTGRGTYLASTRTNKASSLAMSSGGSSNGCYATVYVDGVLLYDQQSTDKLSKSIQRPLPPSLLPPNLDDYNVNQLGGVEYYAGESTAPMGYRHSGCGLLLLWTRER